MYFLVAGVADGHESSTLDCSLVPRAMLNMSGPEGGEPTQPLGGAGLVKAALASDRFTLEKLLLAVPCSRRPDGHC